MDAFPAFFPLAGRTVVVAGTGAAAEAKLRLFAGSPAKLVRLEDEAAFEPSNYAGAALAFIATDATLTKAQCRKVSGLGHDGLARAIRPVHTLLDGDTLFTLASGARPVPDLVGLHALMVAAGDCVTRAVGHALLAATTTATVEGELRSYRDAFPSAFRDG